MTKKKKVERKIKRILGMSLLVIAQRLKKERYETLTEDLFGKRKYMLEISLVVIIHLNEK